MSNPDKEPSAGRGHAALIEKFAVLVLFSLLLGGVYLVLKPFLLGLVFGGILAIATWPVRTRLVARGLSGKMAAGLLLLTLLLVVLGPVAMSAPDLAAEVRSLVLLIEAWGASPPQLPGWLSGLPLIGGSIAATWQGLLGHAPDSGALLSSYGAVAREFVIAAAEELTSSVMNLSIAVIAAASIWASGEDMVRLLSSSLMKLGGRELAGLPGVAAAAVRGVFYGIVGTAAIQGLMMTVGLLIAGVPAAASLGFVTMIMGISQFGNVLINLVWGGAAWWIYSHAGPGFSFWFVVAWGLLVTFIESPLKPLLIGSRLTLPITLVLLGVFGGFISLGFLGLFIGPTLLAVAYELLRAWRGGGADGGAAPAAEGR